MLTPLAFDSETALIRPALLAPPLACVTWQRPDVDAKIVGSADSLSVLRTWLHDPTVLLIGANVAYDMAVVGEAYPELLPSIFDAYAANRVTDVQIRQRLLDIAGGVYLGRYGAKGVFVKHTYDLESLAKRCAGMQLAKDEWRLSYAEFIGVPLKDWPSRAVEAQAKARVRLEELEAAWSDTKSSDVPADVKKTIEGLRAMVASDPIRCREYPLDDARATLAVWQKQEVHAKYLTDQFRKARAYFALHLSSAWGLRTDAKGVEILRTETQAAYDELEEEMIVLGLIRNDIKRTRDTKLAKARMVEVCAREGIRLRRTDGHASEGESKCKDGAGSLLPAGDERCVEHICLDAESCNATEDEILVSYAEISTLKKVLSNDIEALSKGVTYPVHTRYGLAETGRTTSSGPPIQNLCKRPGIREAFVPREGNILWQADYPTLELFTLAQCCVSWLGQSELAKALRAGIDPHVKVAATILRIPYEEAIANLNRPDVDEARQLSKPANFGFPGGMGIKKFRMSTLKAMGREKFERLFGPTEEKQLERAKQLKDEWYQAWPEMPHYFARVNALCANDSGKAFVETLFTGRWRGGASYCAACNNGFQALGADCATNAAWLLARAQYVDWSSPLFNSRTVAFVHDEFIGETKDDDRAHDAAYEVARLMAVGANELLPDVPIPIAKIKPLLMRRWSKKAKPTFDANGRLIAWPEAT